MTRVAVVGAGIVGSATAWVLAERGADVTVYEQFDLDHERGSSHGRTRIVRLAYQQAEWVRLAVEALAGWREVEAASGRELLGLHGLVELAPGRALTSAAVLEACGEEHRFLDRSEARTLGVALPADWAALFQPKAGFIYADAARSALLELAVAGGATIETGTRIVSLDDVDADVVVAAVGPWVRTLVPDVPVRVTRETIAYFRQEGPPQASIVELDASTGLHALYALHDPIHGLKAGAHHAGDEADPDVCAGADEQIVGRIAEWVRHRLPDAEPEPVAAESCFYTTTADETFVLERRGRLVVGSACSGHGFKFAPATGRRLAELALDSI
ncbi:MAG: FAD-dependent oxidoreductase [Gaiellaceae bacterium]